MAAAVMGFAGLAVAGVANTTLYRVTPHNYTGTVDNMDTGDLGGDCLFGLLELTMPFWCPENPNELNCKNFILNDQLNNVYEQHTIEHDTRFGVYAPCNPDPDTGVFACMVPNATGPAGLCWYTNPETRAAFADECDMSSCYCEVANQQAVGREQHVFATANFYPMDGKYQQCGSFAYRAGLALETDSPVLTLHGVNEGQCCDALSNSTVQYRTFYKNGTCVLMEAYTKLAPTPEADTLVHVNFNGTAGMWYFRRLVSMAQQLNGTWYSTQVAGKCKPGQRTGDGCFWRDVGVKRTVNATCLMDNVVKYVAHYNPRCFEGCDTPLNTTSPCAVNCTMATALGEPSAGGVPMPANEMCRGFETSFRYTDPERFGCPDWQPHF